MKSARFEAELVEGHKGVTVVVVPFDPSERWSLAPVRLHGRRHGWPVTGTIGGVTFDGYVGERWGRFFVIVERALRDAAKIRVGDTTNVSLSPSRDAKVIERAIEQSKVTTQPKTARADAIDPR